MVVGGRQEVFWTFDIYSSFHFWIDGDLIELTVPMSGPYVIFNCSTFSAMYCCIKGTGLLSHFKEPILWLCAFCLSRLNQVFLSSNLFTRYFLCQKLKGNQNSYSLFRPLYIDFSLKNIISFAVNFNISLAFETICSLTLSYDLLLLNEKQKHLNFILMELRFGLSFCLFVVSWLIASFSDCLRSMAQLQRTSPW